MQLAAQAYPMKWPAAGLAVAVHAAFLLLLVMSISWQKPEAPGVTVDLWTDIPAAIPKVAPPPPPPEPEVKPAPKVAPKPEPKPAPTPAKPEIALKAKKPEKETPKPAPPKVEKTKADKAKADKAEQERRNLDQLIQNTQARTSSEQATRTEKQITAAQQAEIDKYTHLIDQRVSQKLNRGVCGSVSPKFSVSLIPGGTLRNPPILLASSGIPACDKAVENAIIQADPLPVPSQPELFARFREFNLILSDLKNR